MKNFFTGLLIVGAVAGIVAAFFGLAERVKFNRIAREKIYERNEAVEGQRRAEESKQHAEKLRHEAETKQKIAKDERDKALDEAKSSKESAEKADALRQESDRLRETAEVDRKQAMEEKKAAFEERDKMTDERDRASADLAVEKEARLIAEAKRDDALGKLTEASKELAETIEVSKIATEIVSFVGSFNNILFPCIDDGDDLFIKGLESFAKAKSRQEQYKAIGFVNKARDNYVEAQGKLKRLGYVDERSREIVEISKESTDENIKSVGIISDVLKDMVGSNSMPPLVKQQKADEAAKRKESADRLMIEVCEKLLDLIDTYNEAFTKAQQTHIQELKEKVEDRLGIPSGETSLSGTPE